MNTLTFEFEDAPLFADGPFSTGYVTGSMEVSYASNGDWTVREITIEVQDNYRDTKTVYLNEHRDNVFWTALINSQSDAIDDAVAEALSDEGIYIPSAEYEHRLGYGQLLGAR